MYKILVAVDGSSFSYKALEETKKIAKDTSGQVTVISIGDPEKLHPKIHSAKTTPIYKQIAENDSREVLNKAKEVFDDFDGFVDFVVKVGNAANEIIEYAEGNDFDLIVVGSRGRGAVSRTLLGSVSDKIVRHVNKSVLVVK